MLLLAVMLLIGSASAAEADDVAYYRYEPVTVADYVLAAVEPRATNLTIFGIPIVVSNGYVTKFNGYTVAAEDRNSAMYLTQMSQAIQESFDTLSAGSSSLYDLLASGSWNFTVKYAGSNGSLVSTGDQGTGLLALISRGFAHLMGTMYEDFSYLYNRLDTFHNMRWSFARFQPDGDSWTQVDRSGTGLFPLLQEFAASVTASSTLGFNSLYERLSYTGTYLDSAGEFDGASGMSLASLLNYDLMGLASLMMGTDRSTFLYLTSFDEEGNLVKDQYWFRNTNMLDFLAGSFSQLQEPLARLAYVYASDEDLEFKSQEKENLDTVKDSFFGDGAGSVKPSDITDAADIASGVKDSFSGAGSAGDAFVAISDSNSYSFFSQAVSNSLDTVSNAAVQAAADDEDDFMDGFELGEDGFYHVKDQSFWDVSSFLGG